MYCVSGKNYLLRDTIARAK